MNELQELESRPKTDIDRYNFNRGTADYIDIRNTCNLKPGNIKFIELKKDQNFYTAGMYAGYLKFGTNDIAIHEEVIE